MIFLVACATSPKQQKNRETVYYQALGTNPQWSVEVLDKSIKFSSEDFEQRQQFDIVKSEDGEFKSYQNTDKSQKFSLVLEAKPCLDKVTSQRMRYVATFTFGDITYLGCAQKIDN